MTASPCAVFVAVSHGDELFFVFGSAGWRGKIYSQGMVNKYCSPHQEGPHSFTSGRGRVCMGVCAGTCMCACLRLQVLLQLYEAPILPVCVQNVQRSLFIFTAKGVVQEKNK